MKEKYRYLQTLGKGGMSQVFLVEDRTIGKRWAMKRISKDQDGVWEQFMKEAYLMKGWSHPYLPRIAQVYEDDQYIYLVMDYIEGCNLKEWMKKEGWVSEKQLLVWAKQLAEVLGYLHKQDPPVIYRDMKPENIMITREGFICLIDFGISRNYRKGKKEDTGCLGTRGYAAPEQYGGRGQSDQRTDLFSLGVVLYEMVTGKNLQDPPYEILPSYSWKNKVSKEFQDIILKCTRTDPEKRYQSAGELYRALESLESKRYFRQSSSLLPMQKAVYVSSVGIAFLMGYFFRGF